MNARILPGVALAALILGAHRAEAYTSFGHWGRTSVTLRAHQASFPEGNSGRTSLSTAVHNFNHNPSDFRLTLRFDDTDVEFDNGQSEIWFTAEPGYPPARTTYFFDFWSGHLDEADIVFNINEGWTVSMRKTSLLPWGGSSRPFQPSVLHECGHLAGLGHEADEYNIMGYDYTHVHCNGSTVRSYFGEDASDGLVALYTRKDNYNVLDVSASLFKRTGVSGEYSLHDKCLMYNSTGTELSNTTYEGQKRYRVLAGQRVRVEFTYENSGEVTLEGRVGFYLSTNSTISTADQLIATRTFSLSRDDVVTQYNTITMPDDMPSGTLYLGVIVDDEGRYGEVDENNAAYHIIHVP